MALYSATVSDELDFDMLDRRDFSPVRYRRVTPKPAVKCRGVKSSKATSTTGRICCVERRRFQKANVEATRSIDINDFVDQAEISPIYFDKPYYLAPLKNGQRAYALLRDVLKRAARSASQKLSSYSRAPGGFTGGRPLAGLERSAIPP